MFHEFSCQVVPALGSRYWYRSWLRCERCQMKLRSMLLLLRKNRKGHKLQLLPQTVLLFSVGNLDFFSPPTIHYNIKSILGERTALQQTRPDLFCSMTKCHVEFKLSCSFTLFTALGSSRGPDTVTCCSKVYSTYKH